MNLWEAQTGGAKGYRFVVTTDAVCSERTSKGTGDGHREGNYLRQRAENPHPKKVRRHPRPARAAKFLLELEQDNHDGGNQETEDKWY
jgi:hypothetical protein